MVKVHKRGDAVEASSYAGCLKQKFLESISSEERGRIDEKTQTFLSLVAEEAPQKAFNSNRFRNLGTACSRFGSWNGGRDASWVCRRKEAFDNRCKLGEARLRKMSTGLNAKNTVWPFLR